MIRCVGLQGFDLLGRDLIVAKDLDLQRRVQFAQSLHQVVGKRIVVIDQNDHLAFRDSQIGAVAVPAGAAGWHRWLVFCLGNCR